MAPALQKDFGENIFIQKGARSSYILKDRSYLYIDKKLKEALDVVRKIKDADRETRRQFVKNPRSFIRNNLSSHEENMDELLEFLFVETPAYSARVEDIGVWEQPKLPWINIEGQQWIPNTDDMFIRCGQKLIVASPAEMEALQNKVHEALEKNEQAIEYNGELLNVAELNEALVSVRPAITSEGLIDDALKEQDDSKQNESKERLVLLTQDNFDSIKFEAYRDKPRESAENTLPINLKTSLHPYQRAGLEWMQRSWRSGVTGSLLADDMGLGKTFQVLSFLSWVKEVNKKPVLIVAPTSLSRNWEQEAEKHLRQPNLGNLVRLYGVDLKYLKLRHEKESSIGRPTLNLAELKGADWIITSYETMRDYEHSLGSINFSVIVFDEMQKLKNPSALVTKAAKALNSEFLLGLTGTPVENRLADIHTLCDILRPGFLGSLSDFSKHYESDPNNQQQLFQELKGRLESECESLPPFMLRRMKKDVLGEGVLKAKITQPIKVNMPARQQLAYNEILNQYKTKEQKGKMLEALQGLRKVSLHYADPEMEISLHDLFENSARLLSTAQLLNDIKTKNEKVIIFLESRSIQTELQTYIVEKYGFRPHIINGQTPTKIRQHYVNSFESQPEGFDVIILSPKAAGTGFTLVSANHVIHVSRWWNPAIEDQATDRAYRIGQKKEVFVYYPLAIHPHYGDESFDAKLHQLITRKRTLSDELLLPVGTAEGNMEDENVVKELYNELFSKKALASK